MTTDLVTSSWDELAKQNDAPALGFPRAQDFPNTERIDDLLRRPFNNVGDPYVDGVYPKHTKRQEVEVVEYVADLLRAPKSRWGYVASGGTEATIAALRIARSVLPRALVYFAESAHPSVAIATDMLGLDSVVLKTTPPRDTLDYDDLRFQIAVHRDRPAIVVATAGTTMTESIDSVGLVKAILSDARIPHFIHVDAALSGIALALLPPEQKPAFDFSDGADTMTVSGHKFFGVPMPCAALITQGDIHKRVARTVNYIGTPLSTIATSRNGHAPVLWRYAIEHWGTDGLRQRAELARAEAEYTRSRLRSELGWDCLVNPHAMTVVLLDPVKRSLIDKWALALDDFGRSHVITMPGVPRAHIDEFIQDLVREGIRGSVPTN